MTALPKHQPCAFHFFQQPYTIVQGNMVCVRLSRHEATAIYRWLGNMLTTDSENMWLTRTITPPGVDKHKGQLHFNNVVFFEGRAPMTRTKTPSGRMLELTAPPEPREPNLRARFRPLAESRTAAVIGALDYLGQLSQRARYRYTDEEIEDIEAGIVEKLTETMDAFRRGVGNRPGFKFRSGPKPE